MPFNKLAAFFYLFQKTELVRYFRVPYDAYIPENNALQNILGSNNEIWSKSSLDNDGK